ncbi:hypothetical protein [Paenibacillus sp. URB8-2]|uniref:hypothetical protein n=1 Tax=Paenibacillus sp. URB8-2 TaxID=2741301 RepID=UPI0015B9CD65|nr:hypothetical protein [Paenibacillus sp. URB8-2]BCG56586.1 hypothetical protein PUR_00110 [Paenibacillus sp. URB8-2]
MKRARMLWALLILCIAAVMLAGCGSTKPSWESFEGALNEKSFPVPKEANSPDRTTTNAAMDYVRYSLPGLKEKDSIPEPYFKAIQNWGWHELTEDKASSSHVFKKDQLVVHLTIHDGYFIVMIPKDKKTAVQSIGSQ